MPRESRGLFILKTKSKNSIRVLAVGDIIGRPGRRFLREHLPLLRSVYDLDRVIVNVENAAGGFGVTWEIYQEFLAMGVDYMTSGNHIFDKKGYETWFDRASLLLRPENFPPGAAGKGSGFMTLSGDLKLAVVNIIGRVFMKSYDCPFRAVDNLLDQIRPVTPLILVDFHAETTSEKMAMGWHLAGRVSAVWGTHTHVPTADGRILDGFTGYQTDLGMTGSYQSVIGMERDPVIEGFLTLNRARFTVAKDDVRLGGSLFDLDLETGRCLAVEGLFLSAEELVKISQTKNQGGPD